MSLIPVKASRKQIQALLTEAGVDYHDLKVVRGVEVKLCIVAPKYDLNTIQDFPDWWKALVAHLQIAAGKQGWLLRTDTRWGYHSWFTLYTSTHDLFPGLGDVFEALTRMAQILLEGDSQDTIHHRALHNGWIGDSEALKPFRFVMDDKDGWWVYSTDPFVLYPEPIGPSAKKTVTVQQALEQQMTGRGYRQQGRYLSHNNQTVLAIRQDGKQMLTAFTTDLHIEECDLNWELSLFSAAPQDNWWWLGDHAIKFETFIDSERWGSSVDVVLEVDWRNQPELKYHWFATSEGSPEYFEAFMDAMDDIHRVGRVLDAHRAALMPALAYAEEAHE